MVQLLVPFALLLPRNNGSDRKEDEEHGHAGKKRGFHVWWLG